MANPNTNPNDWPFDEVAEAAAKLVKEGHTIWQKWSCRACGSRQTMAVPNKLFVKGKCEACGALTNIKKRGCNYTLLSTTGIPKLWSEGEK